MRIFVTGGAGQLATDLAAIATADGHDVVAPARAELDISDGAAVRASLDAAQPDVVINCAAWTAVDACEDDPERAQAINGEAVGLLAEACSTGGTHFIQVSTDYVFDGVKDGAYNETDTPNPQSVYGASKLLGERLAGPNAAVVRTSWVYSRHGGNMVATICRLAAEHDTLSFVDDQRGHPTHTADLAVALLQLASQRSTGIWHCTNSGAVSWFEFAQAVLEVAGEDPARVLPISTAQMPRPAPRPANSVLANMRYDGAFDPLPDFRDGLEPVVGAYLD